MILKQKIGKLAPLVFLVVVTWNSPQARWLCPKVLSDWKEIVGLMYPVTIGNHILAEISETSRPKHLGPLVRNTQSHRMSILTIVKFAPRILEP